MDKEDLTEREKARSIQKLYAKTKVKKRPTTRLVVAGKSGRANVAKAKSGPKQGGTGKIKRVDKRMLADKRGEKAAATRRKGVGKGAKSKGRKPTKGKGRRK